MSKIFDNITISFEKGLQDILSLPGVKRADFCVGYFNLRGWSSVADKVETLPGDNVLETNYMGRPELVHRTCRVLVGMNKSPSDLIREIFTPAKPDSDYAKRCRVNIVEDFRRQLLQVPPRPEDEATLTTLKAQLKKGRVTVKLHLRYPLHAKLYLAHRPDDTSNSVPSLMGSSNLTFGGLGGNGELDAEFGDPDDGKKFANWFDERWNDDFSLDITEDLAKALEESWAGMRPTPWEIYLRIMYLLGGEARAGASEFKIPPPFDKKLYAFQASGVQLLLRHLQQRGGAMLGDVVGLGKTMSACAVAKWYEWQNGSSTLVLCPPNLREMWNGYKAKYDMKMDIWSIAEQFDPDKLRPYKLVIIDESHNLRNREGARYARVLDLLKQIDRDVLLLTATPFNKDFRDIAAQLRLILDPDKDLGVRPEKAIAAFGGVQGFAQEYPSIPVSSIQAFEKSEFPEDWNELLRKYLVRRTRYFIKNTYALPDETNPARKYLVSKADNSRNYFPDRIPKSIRFTTVPGDAFERICSEETMDAIGDLRLPRYGLVKYLDPGITASASKADKAVFDSLSRSGKRLIGFSRCMLCKRMDSSGVVFLQSVYEHALRNAVFLHALDKGLDLPIRAGLEFDDGWFETETSAGSLLMEFPSEPEVFAERGRNAYGAIPRTGSQIRWLPAKYFKKSLAADLKKDNKLLLGILERCGAWEPAGDRKVDALEELLVKTHPAEKVLVFTQFSDTARYLCEELKRRGIDHVSVVDGDSNDLIEQVKRFSPVSNAEKGAPVLPVEKQTRVLVATDTISEGQNLQDAHIVVNYDLPWAIIRLIQRVGRVDRIGQNNETVSCYSFFPQEGVDRIIGLLARLNARIANNATAVGSDEIFFEGNPQNLRDIFNEKAGILDEEIDGDVDIASLAYQAWISATKDNKKLRDRIVGLPDAAYTTKAADRGKPGGVVALVRAPDGTDSLVRVAEGGNVIPASARALLEEIACSPNTPTLPTRDDHHALVQAAISEAESDGVSVTEGILGSRHSPQYRLFNLVRTRLEEEAGSLFEADFRNLADALFSRPLREEAFRDFRRIFARGNTPAADILNRALALHGADKLCVPATSPESAPADARRTFEFHEVAFLHVRVLSCAASSFPTPSERAAIDLKLRKTGDTYLAVFFDPADHSRQLWVVPVHAVDRRKLVVVPCENTAQRTFLLEKIDRLAFRIGHEHAAVDVISAVDKAFLVNADNVTKQFYREFRHHHAAMAKAILFADRHEPPIDEEARKLDAKEHDEYASIMLDRLMFCYFIQKKGFLDKDIDYLSNKLSEIQAKRGPDQFFGSFYRRFLRVLFSDGLNTPAAKRTAAFMRDFGRIPYLNGGLFARHPLEAVHDIDIPDEVFEKLFAFFNQWNWHLDTRLSANGRDINPDVLGYIFEQYINDRAAMGAYYTKEDITEYIGRNTIVPWLLEKALGGKSLSSLQSLLASDPDRYIFTAMRKGVDLDLPPEIEKGVAVEPQDTLRARRAEWNTVADESFALPTEIWRETVARRQRCHDVRAKLANGGIREIADFITYNLDIRTFAEDAIRLTKDHLFVRHFFEALREVTILDPTCGSGAFLFAAMNILEPLYEVCLDRMEEFNAENPSLFAKELSNLRGAFKSNRQHFIYKSIILRNLYGVDIMPEAVEIAKLRLFLKMVAVVDADFTRPEDNFGLDPLPDIDFNIRCGNTLVGYASPEAVKDALAPEDSRLKLDQEEFEKVNVKATDVSKVFSRFRKLQLDDGDTTDTRECKKALQKS